MSAPTPLLPVLRSAISSSMLLPPKAAVLAVWGRSAKSSCLTALMEYEYTPPTNAMMAKPVRAFFARNGRRARSRPGDGVKPVAP